MAEPFLRMINVSKQFPGVQALKDVNISACRGEALALIGANGAGKSTLMNVLGGVVQSDEGQILIDGNQIEIKNPIDAANNGIAFVHQEMALLPTLTVAENMFISSFPKQSGFIDQEVMREQCSRVLSRLESTITPDTTVRDLSPGDQQMVEIARALLSEPEILIFDEPTSSLTRNEKELLFDVIKILKDQGVAIIYITHLLDEVFDVCDHGVILRNGKVVGKGCIEEWNYEYVVRMMIGAEEITEYYGEKFLQHGDVILNVEDLCREGVLHNISFEMHAGEVLGLWGLLGSGRTELARAVAGLDPIDEGSIRVRTNGELREIQARRTREWIGMITEDRRDEGLLLPMPVKDNMSLANLPQLISIWPIVSRKREVETVQEYVNRLNISITGIDQRVETLSGGNQQKVIVGRWLQKHPPIFIMDEPTRGLDVGAKAEISRIIEELAKSGTGILFISSDIDEMIRLGHRFLVLDHGRIVDTFSKEATKDDLIAASAGTT